MRLFLALFALWLASFYLAATTARAETAGQFGTFYHVFQNSEDLDSTEDGAHNWFGIYDGVTYKHLPTQQPVYCSKSPDGPWECSNIREVFPNMSEFRVMYWGHRVDENYHTGADWRLLVYHLDNWEKTPLHKEVGAP